MELDSEIAYSDVYSKIKLLVSSFHNEVYFCIKVDFRRVIAVFDGLWYRPLVEICRREEKKTNVKLRPLFPAV